MNKQRWLTKHVATPAPAGTLMDCNQLYNLMNLDMSNLYCAIQLH